jgi:WhiB family redox-sensing transcriptional regulator
VRAGGHNGGRPFGPQRAIIHIPNLPPRDGWIRLAACVGHDPDHWYATERAAYRYARAVCADCPVKTDCLNWALRADEYQGMWGGLSPQQRRHLSRERRAS